MSVATGLILCNLTTFVLTVLTIIYAARFGRLRPIRWLIALSLSLLISSFCSVNVYISQDFEQKVFSFQMRILATVFFAPIWLYFISSVFERWEWLHRKWVRAVIFLPCLVNFVMILIPDVHKLLFTEFEPFSFHDVSVVQFKFGQAYVVFFLWSMLLLFLSFVLSGITFAQEKGYRRWQVLILNAGFGVALSQSLLTPIFGDAQVLEWILVTSISPLCTQIAIMYAVLRHRLLSIVPLAMVRIFKHFPDPVLVLDDSKRLMGASDKAIRVFGLPEEFLGKPLAELLPAVPQAPGEVMITGCNQQTHYFHLEVEKIDNEYDSSGAVLFFRDIGTQKSTELRLNQDMEFRTRLLALLAHDLTGFAESQVQMAMSLERNAAPEHRPHLELLGSSALASQELVSNIMSWAQGQAVEFPPVKAPFEWNLLLKETLEQMRSRLNLKEVEVVYSSSQKVILAEGDSELLAAVFRNILSNSIRATPAGKKIHIRLEATPIHVEVRVRDEGHGIEAGELQRVRESTKDFLLEGLSKSQGSGIGLMMARHFIALHRGEFHITSTLGVGTEVLFSIPF